MIKKTLIISIFLIIYTIGYPQDVSLIKIDSCSVKGSSYFPLFVGAKWTWTLEMFGTKNTFSWEIIECYEITDSKNNLEKVIGFKTVCKEIDSEWFFIEYDGFICFYEKVDNIYEIQKIMPINPKIGDKWSENSRLNMVSTITDEFIKIDTETEDKNTIGYKIFRKDMGLYDLYEVEKKGSETVYTKWTLNEYKNISNESEKENILVKKDENDSNSTTTTTIIKEKEIESNTTFYNNEEEINNSDYFIKSLKSDKSYIQIGSFTTINNAIKIVNKSKKYNYNTFIYLDKDNLYKVLIEIDRDEEKNIQFIKNNIEAGAFFKKRKNR